MKKSARDEPPSKTAIHMLYENDLLEQIEDYRFKNRFPTRAEAVKALIKLGLEATKKSKVPSGRT